LAPGWNALYDLLDNEDVGWINQEQEWYPGCAQVPSRSWWEFEVA
jgi:hypothetical protein